MYLAWALGTQSVIWQGQGIKYAKIAIFKKCV